MKLQRLWAACGAVAVVLFGCAFAALRFGLLPHWTGWLGAAAAAVSLISACTMLGPMNNSSALYGALLLAPVLGSLWIFVTSFLLATELDDAAIGSCEGLDQPAPR